MIDVPTSCPRLHTAGVDGLLVQFADTLTDPANRAALALKSAIEQAVWPEVEEVTMALASTYLRFDILKVSHADMIDRLQSLVTSQDWYAASLPTGRRRWSIPCVFGGEHGPQLAEAAALAGVSEDEAIRHFTSPVRVQALGFAPGQPYLGQLPKVWDIPRQSDLTPQVPAGALTVAIRQFVLFAVDAPTGWRHIGQTAFQPHQPGSEDPFLLRPGDEVVFQPVKALDHGAALGGARMVEIA